MGLDPRDARRAVDALAQHQYSLAAAFDRELFAGHPPASVGFSTLAIAQRLRAAGKPRPPHRLIDLADRWNGPARDIDRQLYGARARSRDRTSAELLGRTRSLLAVWSLAAESPQASNLPAVAATVAFDIVVHLAVLAHAVEEHAMVVALGPGATVALDRASDVLLNWRATA